MTTVAMSRQRLRSALRRVRILYFVHFAAVGIYWTYINVYYHGIGLSGAQIGLINAIVPLVGIAGMTGWGLLNDRFGQTRLLLMAAALGSLVTALGLGQAATFGAIIPLVCLYGVFASAIVPLLDTTTMGLLGAHREFYGRQRIWGSIGYIVSSGAIGFVLQRLGLHAMFGLYAAVLVALAVAALALPQQPVRIGAFSVRGLGPMLRQPPWLIFSASLFLLGMGFAGISNFVSVAMRTMGASDSLIGVAWMLAAVSELPVMFFSVRLFRRFGAASLVAVAMSLYVLRLFLYAVMSSAEWVLGINLLFGAGFGLFWMAAVTFTNELAPESMKTTSQGLFMSVMNLSNVGGALLTGWLFDVAGPGGLFSVLSVLALLALGTFVLGRRRLARGAARLAADATVKSG